MEFSKQIKAIRNRYHYTQAFVAERLCMEKSTYARIEIGKTRLSVDVLIQLSRMYGVDLYDVIGLDRDDHLPY